MNKSNLMTKNFNLIFNFQLKVCGFDRSTIYEYLLTLNICILCYKLFSNNSWTYLR